MKLPSLPALRGLHAIPEAQALAVIFEEGARSLPLPFLDEARERMKQAGFPMAPGKQPATAVVGEPARQVVFVPLTANDPGRARTAAAEAVALLRQGGRQAATIVLADMDPDNAQAVVEGVLSANWRFETADGNARGKRDIIADIGFAADDPSGRIADRIPKGWLVSIAALAARHLATQPANELTPPSFAAMCRVLAQEAGFDLSIVDKAGLVEAGMGGLLAVAGGSRHEPLLIRMDWRPRGKESGKPIVIVGKTVTFDAGGISLKKPEDMDHMKADMAGGAAVFGAMAMIAEARPDFPVTALFPVVENVLGPDAMRPSDVIRTASGKTVEIINTDAEGRLILADALHVAAGLSPLAVIDLATLTGATMGIFGPIGLAAFSNDDEWFGKLQDADRMAGEKVWRMPLWPEYRSFLASPVADLRNYSTTGQSGSTPIAAAFLSHFVGDHPWMHLDIYNTCWNTRETAFMPEGPTGSGARVLAQLLLDLQQA